MRSAVERLVKNTVLSMTRAKQVDPCECSLDSLNDSLNESTDFSHSLDQGIHNDHSWIVASEKVPSEIWKSSVQMEPIYLSMNFFRRSHLYERSSSKSMANFKSQIWRFWILDSNSNSSKAMALSSADETSLIDSVYMNVYHSLMSLQVVCVVLL